MVMINKFFNNLFMCAEQKLKTHDTQSCSKAYEQFKQNITFNDILTKKCLYAGASFLGSAICVIVDYTPLVGRISQWVREAVFNVTYIQEEATAQSPNPPENPSFKLNIHEMGGAAISVDVLETDTIGRIKDTLAKEQKLSLTKIELCLAGEEDPLDDCRTLATLFKDKDQPRFLFLLIKPPTQRELLGQALPGIPLHTIGRVQGYNNGQLPANISVDYNAEGNITGVNNNYYYPIGFTIKASIQSLDSLIHLSIGACGLGGDIPSEIGSLKALKTLDLANNHLTGEVPQSIGALLALQILNLSRNQLKGPIPSNLKALTTLKELKLNDNLFTSNIPDAIGSLTNLTTIILRNNRLAFEIPENLLSHKAYKPFDIIMGNMLIN